MTAKSYSVGSRLPVRSVVANNFAVDSDNRIHSDDVAAEFGFKGGLVPGVAIFSYMTQPVVETIGRDWLERGRIAARFLKPVYHGESVAVHTAVENGSPPCFKVEVKNMDGLLCGVADVELPDRLPPAPTSAAYPLRPMPSHTERFPSRTSAFAAGETLLGSLEFEVTGATTLEAVVPFIDAVCDPLAIYRGKNAACHPALIVAQANQLLKENVDLGPWIHTSSDVQFFALPRQGQRLFLRGKVAGAFTRRRNEFIELDLAMFDSSDRPLAHIRHVAIIHLAPPTV
jgi:MaoC like domain